MWPVGNVSAAHCFWSAHGATGAMRALVRAWRERGRCPVRTAPIRGRAGTWPLACPARAGRAHIRCGRCHFAVTFLGFHRRGKYRTVITMKTVQQQCDSMQDNVGVMMSSAQLRKVSFRRVFAPHACGARELAEYHKSGQMIMLGILLFLCVLIKMKSLGLLSCVPFLYCLFLSRLPLKFRLLHDLYCVGWGVKLYSLTLPMKLPQLNQFHFVTFLHFRPENGRT